MILCCRMFVLFDFFHSIHLLTDDFQRRGVTCEDAIQSLSLLCGVVGVVVANLPLFVFRLGKTAPSPEVAAGKLPALLGILNHQREDVFVIAVAPLGRRSDVKLETVARIAELLHHQRLIQLVANGEVLVNVLLRIVAGTRQVLNE